MHEARTVDVDGRRGQRVTDGASEKDRAEAGVVRGVLVPSRLGAHHSAPRMTMVDVAVQTASPASVASSVRVVTMAWPPASRTASTWSVPTTASPAVRGGGGRSAARRARRGEVDAGLGVADQLAVALLGERTANVGGAMTSA